MTLMNTQDTRKVRNDAAQCSVEHARENHRKALRCLQWLDNHDPDVHTFSDGTTLKVKKGELPQ